MPEPDCAWFGKSTIPFGVPGCRQPVRDSKAVTAAYRLIIHLQSVSQRVINRPISAEISASTFDRVFVLLKRFW